LFVSFNFRIQENREKEAIVDKVKDSIASSFMMTNSHRIVKAPPMQFPLDESLASINAQTNRSSSSSNQESYTSLESDLNRSNITTNNATRVENYLTKLEEYLQVSSSLSKLYRLFIFNHSVI
jgi:hypothetical protein